MIVRIALAAGVAATASAGWAACPTGADLASGIYVTYDDESLTRYYQTTSGEVIEDTTFTDGTDDRYVVVAQSGLFKLTYFDIIDGAPDEASRETVTYAPKLPTGDELSPGKVFSTQSTTSYGDGTPPDKENYTVSVQDETSVTIGGCTFPGLKVIHTYVSPDGVFGISQTLLTGLGIAIYDGTTEVGGPPEVFTALSISNKAP